MKKRVCLLTGGSGTFGNAFIRRYAQLYEIISVYYSGEIRFATQDQFFVDPLSSSRPIAINEHAVHAIQVDLSNPEGIERLVGGVIDAFGRVDFLVNAAAVRSSSSIFAPNALDPAAASFAVNVLAPLQVSVALAQGIWRIDTETNIHRNRNIVNVSSTAGLDVCEDLGFAIYAASTAALNHLTYYMASEFWDIGLRVNAVALDPLAGQSVDAAIEAVADFDASDQTGQVLPLYRSGLPDVGPLRASNAEPQ